MKNRCSHSVEPLDADDCLLCLKHAVHVLRKREATRVWKRQQKAVKRRERAMRDMALYEQTINGERKRELEDLVYRRKTILQWKKDAKKLYPPELEQSVDAPLLFECGVCELVHPHVIMKSQSGGTTIHYFPHCRADGEEKFGQSYTLAVRAWEAELCPAVLDSVREFYRGLDTLASLDDIARAIRPKEVPVYYTVDEEVATRALERRGRTDAEMKMREKEKTDE